MPSNILSTDVGYPTFTTESTDEKIDVIMNYLFMLREQLQYSMSNLGVGNFNEHELDTITDPIYAKIEDAEENLLELKVTAEALSLRLQNAEGDVNDLKITAQGLSARMETAEGHVTQLQATADGLSARMETAEGNITTLQATAEGLKTSVSNAESHITTVEQFAKGIRLTAASGADGTSSTLTLSSGSVTLSSANIVIKGFVTFEGLSGGSTTVNGACLTTGKISDKNGVNTWDLENGLLVTKNIEAYGSFTTEGDRTYTGKNGSVTKHVKMDFNEGKITGYIDDEEFCYIDTAAPLFATSTGYTGMRISADYLVLDCKTIYARNPLGNGGPSAGIDGRVSIKTVIGASGEIASLTFRNGICIGHSNNV